MSNYKVTIVEFNGEGETLTAQARYEQTVEQLDIKAVIDAVNGSPVQRIRLPRSDKGKKRNLLGEVVSTEQ